MIFFIPMAGGWFLRASVPHFYNFRPRSHGPIHILLCLWCLWLFWCTCKRDKIIGAIEKWLTTQIGNLLFFPEITLSKNIYETFYISKMNKRYATDIYAMMEVGSPLHPKLWNGSIQVIFWSLIGPTLYVSVKREKGPMDQKSTIVYTLKNQSHTSV